MLNSLRIQNFKSWQDTGTIQFGAITGFFGTNSSGKTSILQFLLMLKQTVESSDRARVLHTGDEHSYAELGTLYDIIHKHVDPGTLSFDFSWTIEDGIIDISALSEYDMPDIQNRVSFHSEIKYKDNNIILEKFFYDTGEHRLGIMNLNKPSNHKNKLSDYTFFRSSIESKPKFNIIPHRNTPGKFYEFPFIKSDDFDIIELNRVLSYELENQFDTFFYLGPLRDYPKRLYTWAGEQTQGVGNRGERAIAALLASRDQPNIKMGRNIKRRTLEQHVAYWLKELGLIHSFEVRPIAPNRKEYEVRIKRTAESAEVFLTDVGFGVSQLLPVLVLLFYVPEGATIILEQPEIHLHPAVQAGLADVFIDAIKRRNVQIILESHSEHLLQRLQLRMAEKGLNPDKEFEADRAKLYFTSIEEGRSVLTPLQLDDYGNINNWPEGFFGDTLGDAAAKMKAEMKRKMQQQ